MKSPLLVRTIKAAGLVVLLGTCALASATALSLRPVTEDFRHVMSDSGAARMADRYGAPLSVSYRADWNVHDIRPLYTMPDLLVKAFVHSEDRRFYDHAGVNWSARAAALLQNIRRGEVVRGASTITEQTVRLLHPRPRTLWSKWIEGIEAMILERHVDKSSILEFYLNQIPYAANRRGVVQAARYYFNRDLETLTLRELLALVVLARAPGAYDLYAEPDKISAALLRLASGMGETGLLSVRDLGDIAAQSLSTARPSLPVDARHYARFVRMSGAEGPVATTLDSALQSQVQDILDSRMKKLAEKSVSNGAVLIADHTTGDILAWVVAGARNPATKGGEIDPVLAPRQPGSTLKPFLYAAALENGWTAATILNDAPVAEAVGAGLHRFRNYSNTHYGPITLREALGNSLNIPAILAIQKVGVTPFLETLHALGFDSLDRGASIYDEGLALGNGEVTLYELVRAYAALANAGQTRPLRALAADSSFFPADGQVVFTPETASLIGHILSDPRARALEFGSDSVLNLPIRTAAKTGTSTDYRDAWTLAYNDKYVVGVWMGNLDRTPMKDVTGSTGPALVMRSVFGVLNRDRDTKPLYFSPALIAKDVCIRPSTPDEPCPVRTEYFASVNDTSDISSSGFSPPAALPSRGPELVRPTPGLMMAYDPRIPAERQKFRFELAGLAPEEKPEWILNGQSLGTTDVPHYLWPLRRGPQKLEIVIHGSGNARTMPPVEFLVR